MDDKSTAPQRVRFEEVTPANEPAAFLNVDLDDLVAPLKLPIYDGYDGLDEMRFAYLTLPSGETVVLGAYLTCPQPGTDLYIDEQLQHSAQIVFEACQYLNLDRSTISWFHPDFQEEIDLLYTNKPINLKPQISSQIEGLVLSYRFEPIDCFNHAISIYDRERFPKYWAMLHRNLGLAYSNRMEGDLRENLERSIVCFHNALEIHTLEDFRDRWEIDNQDLATSRKLLNRLSNDYKLNLIKEIIARPIEYRNLQNIDLSSADLSNANMYQANLSNADLSNTNLDSANLHSAKLNSTNLNGANLNCANLLCADLHNANISGGNLSNAKLPCANLTDANLTDANLTNADMYGAILNGTILSGADVKGAIFGSNEGIGESIKKDLIARGATFEDLPGDRSQFRTPVLR